MNALIIRASEGHIAAPLISDHPIVHYAPNDIQHLIVKEQFWGEAWWLEGHREKVAMRSAVRLVIVDFQISEKKRPKRITAGIDQGRRKMSSEDAIAPVLDLDDLVSNPYLAIPRSLPVCQTSASQTTIPKSDRARHILSPPLSSAFRSLGDARYQQANTVFPIVSLV
jgi:hypothetical protein